MPIFALKAIGRLVLPVALLAAPSAVLAQGKDVEQVVQTSPIEQDGKVTLSVGIDLSTGRYGDTERTNVSVVPVSLRVRASDSLSLTAGIAAIRITGPNVVVGADGRPLPGVPIGRATRSGIGDLSVGATWDAPIDSANWVLQFSGRVKLPLSPRSKGLSTGKVDYSVGAELTFIEGAVAPFASVEYRVPGRLDGAGFRNTVGVSVGTAWILGDDAIIASYDYDQAISPLVADGHSFFAAYSHPIGKRLRITGFGIKGFSQGSPSIEGGVLLSRSF